MLRLQIVNGLHVSFPRLFILRFVLLMFQASQLIFSLFLYIIKSVFLQLVEQGMVYCLSLLQSGTLDCKEGSLSLCYWSKLFSGGFFKREGRARDHEVRIPPHIQKLVIVGSRVFVPFDRFGPSHFMRLVLIGLSMYKLNFLSPSISYGFFDGYVFFSGDAGPFQKGNRRLA